MARPFAAVKERGDLSSKRCIACACSIMATIGQTFSRHATDRMATIVPTNGQTFCGCVGARRPFIKTMHRMCVFDNGDNRTDLFVATIGQTFSWRQSDRPFREVRQVRQVICPGAMQGRDNRTDLLRQKSKTRHRSIGARDANLVVHADREEVCPVVCPALCMPTAKRSVQ
jgi:hypothetical protein